MEIRYDNILDHARERFPSSAHTHGEQIEAFKRFLQLETQRLRMRHRSGLGGDEIAAGRCYQVDLVVKRVCQAAAEDFERSAQTALGRCALLALGGYGRGELAPYSDVDILFLHPDKPEPVIKQFVEKVLLLLWDAGLTVGHSYRSIDECLAIARQDVHSRTAMSDARLLTGSADLRAAFLRRMDEALYRSPRETEAFLAALRAETAARYEKHGGAVGLLEPNVKESAGGLRDLHTVLWIGHARFGHGRLDDLRAVRAVTPEEYVQARRAYSYLTRVRNEAHFAIGRKLDILTLDVQPEIAHGLGYRAWRGLAASELFMREYYQRANELHRLCQAMLVRSGLRPKARRLRLPLMRARQRDGLVVRDRRLQLAGETAGFSSAMQMLRAFDTAQQADVELADELKLAIRKGLELIDPAFRRSQEAGRLFAQILGRRGRVGSTLRAMHETGFLGRYLPEFARITFLVQHDAYHRYTIDEHTLRAIEALDDVAAGRSEALTSFKKVMGEIEDATSLYLGVLMHDIGKGRGGGHVAIGARLTARVGDRLGLARGVIGDSIFLVSQHLVMSQLSQRRDLSEEALTLGFAETVGDMRRLNLLLLLTYADQTAVAPGVFSDWRAGLLWELYNHTRAHLTGKAPIRWDVDRRARVKGRIVQAVRDSFPPSVVERHLAMLPEKYLRVARPEDVLRHLGLVERLGSEPVVVDWRASDRQGTELTICTQDAPGVFAKLAGTLTVNGLDILSVDLFTREDGVVLDTFKVSEWIGHRPVAAEHERRIAEDLRAAMEGRLDVHAAFEAWRAQLAPAPRKRVPRRVIAPRVGFDAEASASASVVEVRAADQPGLAYSIAHSLATLGLNITFAKIASEKNAALDVFYVTDSDGGKLAPERMREVERVLLAALGRDQDKKDMEVAG
jgi:[protein-PII] uridylyltransferase